jgi:hypothetical protein
MNIRKSVDDALELLQNLRLRAIKGNSSGEFNYGKTCAYNECINIVKDIRKAVIEQEKLQGKEPVKDIPKVKPKYDMQVV